MFKKLFRTRIVTRSELKQIYREWIRYHHMLDVACKLCCYSEMQAVEQSYRQARSKFDAALRRYVRQRKKTC
jgi:sugar diacid utilization regulator